MEIIFFGGLVLALLYLLKLALEQLGNWLLGLIDKLVELYWILKQWLAEFYHFCRNWAEYSGFEQYVARYYDFLFYGPNTAVKAGFAIPDYLHLVVGFAVLCVATYLFRRWHLKYRYLFWGTAIILTAPGLIVVSTLVVSDRLASHSDSGESMDSPRKINALRDFERHLECGDELYSFRRNIHELERLGLLGFSSDGKVKLSNFNYDYGPSWIGKHLKLWGRHVVSVQLAPAASHLANPQYNVEVQLLADKDDPFALIASVGLDAKRLLPDTIPKGVKLSNDFGFYSAKNANNVWRLHIYPDQVFIDPNNYLKKPWPNDKKLMKNGVLMRIMCTIPM